MCSPPPLTPVFKPVTACGRTNLESISYYGTRQARCSTGQVVRGSAKALAAPSLMSLIAANDCIHGHHWWNTENAARRSRRDRLVRLQVSVLIRRTLCPGGGARWENSVVVLDRKLRAPEQTSTQCSSSPVPSSFPKNDSECLTEHGWEGVWLLFRACWEHSQLGSGGDRLLLLWRFIKILHSQIWGSGRQRPLRRPRHTEAVGTGWKNLPNRENQ